MHLFRAIDLFWSLHMLKQHASLPLRYSSEQQRLVDACLRLLPTTDYPANHLPPALLPYRTVLPVPCPANPSVASQTEAYLRLQINLIAHRAVTASHFGDIVGKWRSDAKGLRLMMSRCGHAGDHLAPVPEGSVACGAVLTAAQAVVLDMVEDSAVDAQEAPGIPN